MTDEELKTLAVDISEGKVFGSWMVPAEDAERLMPVIFMPLALGAAEKIQDQDVWGLYEYCDKATRRTVKGYPLFISFKTLSQADCDRLRPLLEKLKKMKEEFLSL